MRMILNAGTIAEVVFEGTPDELAEFQQRREAGSTPSLSADFVEAGDRPYVTEEVAYRTLTRIRLSVEQRAVIALLYRRHREWVWATDIQKEIGYSTSQFSGLMGAFGRRLTHTQGYKAGTWFFEQEWDATHECNRYRLPDSVRAAVVRAKIV